MSAQRRASVSGLTAAEHAVLLAVEECTATAEDSFAPTTEVLELVDARTGLGPRYAQRIVRDLIVDWVRHVPLLDGDGNFGSVGGDEGADARYTKVRLAPVGELALAAERGEVGPLPLDLIEGSLYRGGGIPPFDPAVTVRALLVGAAPGSTPRTPTGTITVDPTGPVRRNGRWVQRYQLGAVIRTGPGPDQLVLTEPPFLVGTDTIAAHLRDRLEQARRRAKFEDAPPNYAPSSFVPSETVPLRDVTDLTSGRTGTQIVLQLTKGIDVIDAVDWVRSVWPVTVHVDCVSYEEIYDRFALWSDLDTSGVHALDELLNRLDPTAD